MTGDELAKRFSEVRAGTLALAAPLSAEDCAGQSMPLASPAKWHLAHTTWFFETLILERLPDYTPFEPAFRMLFNSYYHSVGPQFPQPRRGLLTRPGLAEVLEYRRHVEARLAQELASGTLADALPIVELGLQHEQQHQELLLTDAKHLLAQNPLRPAYRRDLPAPAGRAGALRFLDFEGGLWEMGHAGPGFAFDNESPRHRVHLEPFQLASRLVTNGEYLAFMADGGYSRPELWLSDGWARLCEQGWRAPLYWEEGDGAWQVFTLAGLRALAAEEPVCHVSHFEADAYARWAGARLATEAEWERAAGGSALDGNTVESGLLHPSPPAPGAAPGAPRQLFGDVWEWTGSAYSPYPGFRPLGGALGEYNGKFMSGQLVLRGGSCATPRSHLRASYRNFFPPDARWQFSGIRLARDLR